MIFYNAHQTEEDKNFDYTLFLGAILHDIGKFFMRTENQDAKKNISKEYEMFYKGEGKYSPRHQEWSAFFVEHFLPESLKTVTSLVLYHHRPSSYQQFLISVADKISAKVDRKDLSDEEAADDKSKYLISVLSQISLDEKKGNTKTPYYKLLKKRYEVEPPSKSFNTDAKDDYQNLWSEFSKKVNASKNGFGSSFDLEDFATAIYNLLRIYTYNIPSAFYYSQPDISLWAHSKSTAAIAFCLDRQLKKEFSQENERVRVLEAINTKLLPGNESAIKKGDYPYFCLVKGDVSGIQDFVFDTKMDGALKALKAKSFYISFLLDTIARYILKEEKMPICNLIYNGGGHFYLLMPGYFMRKLSQYQQKIDKILFSAHRRALSVLLEAAEVDLYDFAHNFGDCFDRVSRNIQKKKACKFKNVLEETKMEFFEPWEDYEQKCPHCGRKIEPKEDDPDFCRFCKSFVDFGDDLMKSLFVIDSWGREKEFSEFSDIHNVLKAFGRYVQFSNHYESVSNTLILDRSRIEDLQRKQMEIEKGQKGPKSGFESEFCEDLDISTHVPFKNEDEKVLMLIDDIAESAKGIKTWGIVRGDVDNLGDIFKKGLGEDNSISRVMTLSEEFSIFFGYYFNKLIKEQNGNIMVIYAGGDDFCILGQWDVLPQTAHRIYTEFRSFSCWNSDVTLSMGFEIAPDKKYPIYRVAMVCGDHLEQAKEYERENGKKKDCFAFGANFVGWEEFEDLKKLKELIADLVGNKNVSKALINGIYAVCSLKKMADDQRELFKAWRFVYFMARLKERYSKCSTELESVLNKIIDEKTNTLYKHSYLAARWAELELRR
ncbi:CRISPR-associated protein, Csm1 family [Caldicellulosiruptor saccharolyticus DSM 8903]|uniref:CRISPR system single-strand-specific deoxyribonuclease Cas10/Csm1 (subtype III-A) n=1 Tax=Caldicellulosiruptor saccharolyticus (strain ATCC 43494 / DSM 8903 / Tp8T 6331) TaxID=351627 RepID=A4XFP4_CALS8|nr:type III-A CRISPR-associated protein Cas10/Csm1 [Caldicellulosiruptor saccharolyticus]ABP65729.1 CRISPR-associated protein, Csm1 family [Caldicellulosiruptor saccharolyticus DSM 8903]